MAGRWRSGRGARHRRWAGIEFVHMALDRTVPWLVVMRMG